MLRSRTKIPATMLATTTLLASCGGDGRLPPDRTACDKALRDAEAVDALEWLKTPPGDNRLGRLSTDAGLALVYTLSMRGAGRLVVVGARRRAGAPGEDVKGLAFTLPTDPTQRRAVFDLYAKQVRAEGYLPRADEGQDCLFIAFD